MKCFMCGTEIQDGIRTCPECGAKIIADGTQEKEKPWQEFAETRRMHDRNCPYCNREMDHGYIHFPGVHRREARANVRWNTGNLRPFSDMMGDSKFITAARYQDVVGTVIEIPAYYCDICKKMIIETDLTQKL